VHQVAANISLLWRASRRTSAVRQYQHGQDEWRMAASDGGAVRYFVPAGMISGRILGGRIKKKRTKTIVRKSKKEKRRRNISISGEKRKISIMAKKHGMAARRRKMKASAAIGRQRFRMRGASGWASSDKRVWAWRAKRLRKGRQRLMTIALRWDASALINGDSSSALAAKSVSVANKRHGGRW